MGAYQALQERGVRVPEDVSVLSFDDTSFARWLRPGLTTFAFPQRRSAAPPRTNSST
jgi:LacI family transcriptional regulator